jgi:hypothetical protein
MFESCFARRMSVFNKQLMQPPRITTCSIHAAVVRYANNPQHWKVEQQQQESSGSDGR